MQLDEMMRGALQRNADGKAVCYQGRWYSWSWLNQVANRLDDLLQAAGVGAEQPVGVISRNRPGFVATLLGLLATRRSIVMVYAFQSGEAIAKDLRALKLKAVVADEQDWSEAAVAAASEVGTMALALGGASGELRALPGLDKPADGLRGPLAEPAIEMLTSGTTGLPKRLALSFATILRSMVGESSESVKRFADTSDLAPALMMFPFGNISGLYSYFPMAAGGRPVVLLEKFTVQGWWDFVKQYRPTQMNLPPAGVRMVLDANVPKEDLDSVEYIGSGAAWLDPNIQREFEQRYGIPILLSYGATEFGGVLTLMTPDDHRQFGAAKFGSVGRAWAGTQLRVVDADSGAELPAGEMGLLEILSARCGPDWVRTTDLASIDSDGFLYHRGRADGAIMRGGYKIIPEIVAEKLSLHPAVGTCAVVGLPDARLGEVPVAAFELRPGAVPPTASELEAHARAHLYSTHIPVAFKQVESLPRTPSMKVSIPGVRELFANTVLPTKTGA